jgi:hypothetical protein
LYSPVTLPGGAGFWAPGSGGSRAKSALSGSSPSVPTIAPSLTVASNGCLPPSRQLTSPVSLPFSNRSLPAPEASACWRLMNWPDWRTSIVSPRQALPCATS